MNRRQICTVVVCFLAFANVAIALSKDRDNPTRLTSSKISSPIYVDNTNETFYYSFEAGPGEVTATLTVDPERGGTNQVVVDFLLSETEKNLATLGVYTWLKAQQQGQRFTLSRRQMVTMKIWITSANDHSKGRYQVLLGGAVHINQGGIASVREPTMPPFNRSAKDEREDRRDGFNRVMREVVPKGGILRVKMKDGSVSKIDLNKVKEIMLEP